MTTEQGNSRGKRVRQQGSLGERERVTRNAELEDKDETEKNRSNDPGPAWKVLKLDMEAYPKINDTSYGWRVWLPHSPGGRTYLCCRCVPGMGHLDNIAKDIRVPNWVQKRENTGQGKHSSMDSQTKVVHSRASGHHHTKALKNKIKKILSFATLLPKHSVEFHNLRIPN